MSDRETVNLLLFGGQHEEIIRMITRLREERDAWIRSFNRLDAAVSHHKAEASQLATTEWDDALYAARDRILRDMAQ